MRHFLCVALREIQYGRRREALSTQPRGGPCDGQTRQEPLAWLSTTPALLGRKAEILQKEKRDPPNSPKSLERALGSLLELR